jgi:hypothetical protein
MNFTISCVYLCKFGAVESSPFENGEDPCPSLGLHDIRNPSFTL